jgi:hypothetical protein
MRLLIGNQAPLLGTRRGQVLLATGTCLAIALAWHAFQHPLVVLAAGLAPFALLGVLRMPFPVVLAFVVFSFFRIHEVIQPLYPLRIPQLLALGALGSLAWGLWHRQIRVYWRPELTVFAVFFTLVTLGVLLATNRPSAIEAWTGTYSKIGIMVLAIAWLATSREAFRLTVRVVLACGLLLAMVTLYNKANGIGLVEGTRATIARNLGSMLGDPNDLAHPESWRPARDRGGDRDLRLPARALETAAGAGWSRRARRAVHGCRDQRPRVRRCARTRRRRIGHGAHLRLGRGVPHGARQPGVRRRPEQFPGQLLGLQRPLGRSQPRRAQHLVRRARRNRFHRSRAPWASRRAWSGSSFPERS